MIITVGELKKFITTDLDDSVLEVKLQALELLIRKYTNNSFQKRNIWFECQVMSQKLYLSTDMLSVGDTVQVSRTLYNEGIYSVTGMEDGFIELDRPLLDESEVIVTKVEYPIDVVMGAVNMLKWDLDNRDKVGIASETISRHSVTYFDMSGDNAALGYPKALLSFLKPYKKARF